MKDHEIAALVNELTQIGFIYSDHESLRQRISSVLAPKLKEHAYPAPRKLITADNVAEWLRDMDKPTCLYTLCADDSATPQTLESGCSGAVLWYLGDDGKGEYPKFCHHCGGVVKSGGLANDRSQIN